MEAGGSGVQVDSWLHNKLEPVGGVREKDGERWETGRDGENGTRVHKIIQVQKDKCHFFSHIRNLDLKAKGGGGKE